MTKLSNPAKKKTTTTKQSYENKGWGPVTYTAYYSLKTEKFSIWSINFSVISAVRMYWRKRTSDKDLIATRKDQAEVEIKYWPILRCRKSIFLRAL